MSFCVYLYTVYKVFSTCASIYIYIYMLYNIQETNYSTDHLEKCFLYVFLMCIMFGFVASPPLTNYFGLGPDVAVPP